MCFVARDANPDIPARNLYTPNSSNSKVDASEVSLELENPVWDLGDEARGPA